MNHLVSSDLWQTTTL